MSQKNASSHPIDVGALLQEVVDEMLEGLQIISPEWRYLYVNKTAAKHGKKSVDELTGKTMMECYPGIEDTDLIKSCRTCMEKRVSDRFENTFVFPNGKRGWFELFIQPVLSDSIMILSVDITRRFKDEIELKEKIEEIEVLAHSSIEREVRMVELKDKINELKKMNANNRTDRMPQVTEETEIRE